MKIPNSCYIFCGTVLIYQKIYNELFSDNSRKYERRKLDSSKSMKNQFFSLILFEISVMGSFSITDISKTMSGKIDSSYFLKNPTLSSHTFLNYL